MHVGFTGTRIGCNAAQKAGLWKVLENLHRLHGIEGVHHGDCIGADADFDAICHELSFYRTSYPAFELGHKYRAGCDCEEIRPLKRPLVRNRDIVDACDVMIATPRENAEVERGSGHGQLFVILGRSRELSW